MMPFKGLLLLYFQFCFIIFFIPSSCPSIYGASLFQALTTITSRGGQLVSTLDISLSLSTVGLILLCERQSFVLSSWVTTQSSDMRMTLFLRWVHQDHHICSFIVFILIDSIICHLITRWGKYKLIWLDHFHAIVVWHYMVFCSLNSWFHEVTAIVDIFDREVCTIFVNVAR